MNPNLVSVLEELAGAGGIELDGQILEGGGQVIRQSVAFSALLHKAILISNVRGGRPKPGLQRQHCTGVELVASMCSAKLSGAHKDSRELLFLPGDLSEEANMEDYLVADIVTAGAIMLLKQVSLPVAIFSSKPLVIEMRGGTNATNAPQIDYAQHVFLPMLRLFGVDVVLEIKKRGFFPKGGGSALVKVNPVVKSLSPIKLLKRGSVNRIIIAAYSAGRFLGYSTRMAFMAQESMAKWAGDDLIEPDTRFEEEVSEETAKSALGDGFGLVLVAHTSHGCILAGSALGEARNSTAESVVNEACSSLRVTLAKGCCVDEYLQDQLIVYMALAEGTSQVKMGPLSLHTKTAIHFAEVMSGARFQVTDSAEFEGDDTVMVKCIGMGYAGRKS